MRDAAAPSITPNRTVIGARYELYEDQQIGAGGIARVFRGRDLRSRRRVAIKALREEYQTSPESRRRFRQEARMMAFASHPGLVTIYDLIEQPSGSWIVMEEVPGRNLKELVEEDGPLPVAEVVRIIEQVASALAHLHSRQIVHLDIKPQNLILTADGGTKLIDFGLAQSVAQRQDLVGGSAFGTAAYLSPEQGRGGAVDQRTDIYALGCVIHELLTGHTPFEAPDGPGQKEELIRQHLEVDPASPSQLRPDLAIPFWMDDVVARALEKDPSHRFATVQELANAVLAGFDVDLPLAQGRTHVLPAPARRPAVASAVDEEDDDDGAGERVGPSLARRAITAGGRAARRSRPLHATIWRLALVFAIGNLMLGTVLLVRSGPEALVERFLSVVPGTTTEVAVDSLNLRAGPGADQPILAVLASGNEVEVTGLSESDEQGRWWPVKVQADGERLEGWVWSGGLQSNEWTGRMSFMQGIVEEVHDVRDGIADGVDTVTDLWPF